MKPEQIFGKTAQLTVLQNIINKQDMTYLSGIAEETLLSHSSVGRVIKPLAELGVITEGSSGKQIRTFTLNEENKVSMLVVEFLGKVNTPITEVTGIYRFPEEIVLPISKC